MYFFDRAAYLLFGCAICLASAFVFVQASTRQVKVEFRLAETTPGKGLTAAKVRETGEEVYLHEEAIITNGDIIEARVREQSDIVGLYQVTVAFTKKAAERMAAATERNRGHRIAILIDGHVILAVRIPGRIYDKAAISVTSKEEAESLVRALSHPSGGDTR